MPAPDLPESFGRYRILKRLGQGGMGAVHLAEDTQLQRRVALKVANHDAPGGLEARKRLLAEARAAATLDHPYLCPVYDAGEIDGRLFLTMAYIEGQSLDESTRGEALPARQVAALVGKLALALQEAHAKGVIHRDLKPSNVMIKSTGGRREPVIVDFGLARRDHPGEPRLTRTGQVMGTLDYMAPEQLRGDSTEIGPACDIYALGVILYELLTGHLPFHGSGLAVVGQILTQAPLPPSSHLPDLDPRLEVICLKAMAKAPADRHASMADLAAALTDYLRSPSTSSTPTSGPSTSTPTPTRSGILVARLLDRVATDPTPGPDTRTVGDEVPSRRFAWAQPAVASLVVVLVLLGAWMGGLIKLGMPDGDGGTDPSGFKRLFNGRDLSGWKTHPSQPGSWRVEEGILVGSGPRTSHLYTDRNDYQDFHLRVESRINGGGNGGVFFRASFGPSVPASDPMWPRGYEAQINSTHQDREKTGSLYDSPFGHLVGVDESQHFPGGWFVIEVIAEGNHIVIEVNGKRTVDYVDPRSSHSRGHIALQQLNPSAVVEFRKIEIKELDGTPRTPIPESGSLGGLGGDNSANAGEFLGQITHVDVAGQKLTIESATDGKTLTLATNNRTEILMKSGTTIVDMKNLAVGLSKAQSAGRKGMAAKVTHKRGFASRIFIATKKSHK